MFAMITKYLKEISSKPHNRGCDNEYQYLFEAASMDHYFWYLQADPELIILQSEKQRCLH